MQLKDSWKDYLSTKPDKVSYLWDSDVKAFGIKLLPSGSHKWVGVKMIDRVRHYITIGPIHDLTYKQAVTTFHQSQHDPALKEWIITKKEGRKAPTFTEMIDLFYENKAKHQKSRVDILRTLQVVAKILPPSRKVHDIGSSDLNLIQEKITKKAMFNKCIAYISSIWNWANKRGYFPDNFQKQNPTKKVDRYTLKPRKRYLNKDEFKRFWVALEAESEVHVKYAIQMLCLTGARKNEVLSLQWEDVDLDRGLLTFRDTKNSTDHIIPITPTLMNVLKKIPKVDDSPFLFPSDSREGHLMNMRKTFERIKKRSKIAKDFTFHDIRKSVATYLLSIPGVKMEDVAASLNHKDPSTTSKHYAFVMESQKAKALTHLEGLFAHSSS